MKGPQVLALVLPASIVLGLALARLSDAIDNWSNKRKIAAIVLIIILLTVAAIIAMVLETTRVVTSAGGTKVVQPRSPRVAARTTSASSPSVVAEGGGTDKLSSPLRQSAEAAQLSPPAAPPATSGTGQILPPFSMSDFIQPMIVAAKQNIAHQQERANVISRIDGYLHNCGSPMEGLGWAFYDSAARFLIEPRLAVAIAQAESSAGLCCFAPYNYWGGLAYRHGFSGWIESINTHLDWLHNYFGSPQTSYDCGGYCIPDHPWMENVERVMESI